MENGYRNIVGLKAIKALNTPQEASLDYTREEIDQNIRALKSKLSSPLTEPDASLYDSIKKVSNLILHGVIQRRAQFLVMNLH